MNEDISLTATIVASILVLAGSIFGVVSSRRQSQNQGHSESDLRFGTMITGLSASAAGNSAFILVGAVGLGYSMGISAIWIAAGFWVGDILFWHLVAPRLIRRVQETGVDTISELVSLQSTTAKLAPLRVGAIVVIIAVGLYCVAQFLAVGKIAIDFFEVSKEAAMALVITVGLASVLLGGLGSSMLVNVYQSVLMIAAAIILTLFIATQFFAGGINISTHQDVERLLDPFYGFTELSFAAFFMTFVFSGLLFATCNPNVLTRITKGEVGQIPRIRWIYMGFMQSLWWLMTLAGVALAIVGQSAPDPDTAGIAFAQTYMPALLLGVFLAGVAAASMSTGEAQLLVVSNALTMDLAPSAFKKLSAKNKTRALIAGRIVVAVALFVTLMTLEFGLIGELVIKSASILVGAFAIPAFLFVFAISVGGRIMAVMIIAGSAATILTRVLAAPPPGQEIFSGLAVSLIVAAIGVAIRKKDMSTRAT